MKYWTKHVACLGPTTQRLLKETKSGPSSSEGSTHSPNPLWLHLLAADVTDVCQEDGDRVWPCMPAIQDAGDRCGKSLNSRTALHYKQDPSHKQTKQSCRQTQREKELPQPCLSPASLRCFPGSLNSQCKTDHCRCSQQNLAFKISY